ncbi:MAG TPA: MFS transporter [Acidimicrobiales bacterium]|jgi:MFS family permease|nr:MFS transporter [Acidimicrobiales bacterium]
MVDQPRPVPAFGVASGPAVERAESRRPLRDLLFGQAVSSLGDWMGTVALMALVLEITGSATAVGGVLVLRLAPTVLAGPVAARLTQRWSRRRTMLAMDAVRAPAVLVLPWMTQLWWIYLWAFVVELAGMVFLPARDASIPDLVEDEDDLATANGLVLGTSYGMIPVGAGLFALVSAVAGEATLEAARVVFLVDAVTFVISYLAISRLPELGTVGAADDSGGGFRDALRLPLVRRLAPVAAVVAFGLGALFSIGIVWVNEVLDATDTEFGLLVACFGVGAGGGLLILRQLGNRDLTLLRTLLIFLGGVVATMSLAPAIGFALLGALGFGALVAMVLATSMELLQHRLGDRDRLLGFAVFHVVIRGGLALAAMGAGLASDLLDRVSWPLLGRLDSSQVVLLSSGALVVAVAIMAGRPGGAATDPAVDPPP